MVFHGLIFVNSPQQHSIDENSLSGDIPSEVGEMTALTRIYLSKCLILLRSHDAVAFSSCFMD